MNIIVKAIKEPMKALRILCLILLESTSPIWNDESYLKIKFFLCMHKKLNLKEPKSFSEKLQWLKLHDRKPVYTLMVDKIEAKKYVAEIIGKEYIIPTYAVWDNADDIDFNSLPDQFVLKCNHDCGGMCICPDKSKIDFEKVRKGLRKGLKRDYYLHGREWSYKNVKRRILAEKYMVDESGYELKDYKIFCFDGVPKFMFIASDRQLKDEETKFDFFDMNFNHLPFTNGHFNSRKQIQCPSSFEKMKELAAKLSQGIPHLRVDFYDINGHIYFGELTFSHWNGMTPFEPEEWDYKFGELIHLSLD